MSQKLRIAFPRLPRFGGPNIFMRRLRDSVCRQGLAAPRSCLHPFYDIGLFTSKARSYYGKPYVLRIDGVFPGQSAQISRNKHINAVIQRSLVDADAVIYQARFDQELAEDCFGIVKQKSLVICNGAQIKPRREKKALRQKFGFPTDRRILICSGRWRRHKRLPEIVETLTRLNALEDCYALIVLGECGCVGRDEPYVYRMGKIEPTELTDYYQCADVYIHLAWIDHCPNTVVEAIANGLPVICSNLGGTRELVEGACAGIVSECDAHVDLHTNNLHTPTPDYACVIQDIQHLFAFYDAYRRRIRREYVDIDHIAGRYLTFIEDVWQEGRARARFASRQRGKSMTQYQGFHLKEGGVKR